MKNNTPLLVHLSGWSVYRCEEVEKHSFRVYGLDPSKTIDKEKQVKAAVGNIYKNRDVTKMSRGLRGLNHFDCNFEDQCAPPRTVHLENCEFD